MSWRDTHPDALRPGRLAAGLALIPFVGGLLSLSGWALDVPGLADWGNAGVAIQPNAGLLLVCAGGALLGLHAGWTRAGMLLAAFEWTIAALTIVEHLLQVELGIDRVLLFDRSWGQQAVTSPGRMGMPGSMAHVLIASALLILARPTVPQPAASRRYVPRLALSVAALMMLSVTGYLNSARQFYSIPALSAISPQTSIMLLVMAAALIAATPDRDPTRTLRGSSAAAILARLALPPLLILPLAMDLLRTQGEARGWFEGGTGHTLATMLNIVIAVLLMWWALVALREHEAALRASIAERERAESLFRTLAEAAPMIVSRADPDGRAEYVNPYWSEFTGRDSRDFVSGGWHSSLHPDDQPRLLAAWTDAVKSGTPLEQEFRARAADGEFRWLLARGRPVRGEQGRVLHWVMCALDIDARKRLEVALIEDDRRKNEFLATLGHELRNPLAPVRNSLQILRLAGQEGTVRERVADTIERQVVHMVRLVDDLLEVSRITRGKVELRKELVDVRAVVQSTIESSMPAITASGCTLSVDVPPHPLIIEADPVRLAQVLGNLLTNAAKYTERGGSITVSAREVPEQPPELELRVRDTGAGIPKDMLPRVFDLFTQVDRTLGRAQGGLGIGLAIVRSLVQQHGGRVEARSEGPGHGCEFVIRLPMVASSAPALTTAERAAKQLNLKGRKLLVVDDNADAADSLAMLLELMGAEVRIAYDGPDALAQVELFQPVIVFLDLSMPGLDGYAVARLVRADPRNAGVTLVAVTGLGQEEDRRRARAAGFDHFVVKPVSADALAALFNPDALATGAAVR